MRRLWLVAPLLLAGCALPTAVDEDPRLTERIVQLRETGGEKTLGELLPGDWDTAHVVLGPATSERIDEQVGREVGVADFLSERGQLLVLDKGGQLQRVVEIGTRGLREGSYGPGAALRAAERELELTGG